MKYISIFRENSLEDYQNGINYYERISSNLADRFDIDFKLKLDDIEEDPFLYQIRYRNIRVAYLTDFPFGIHFIIEKDIIHIIKILHTKRHYF